MKEQPLKTVHTVLKTTSLNRRQKVTLLKDWLYDAIQRQVADEENMGADDTNNIEDITKALKNLGSHVSNDNLIRASVGIKKHYLERIKEKLHEYTQLIEQYKEDLPTHEQQVQTLRQERQKVLDEMHHFESKEEDTLDDIRMFLSLAAWEINKDLHLLRQYLSRFGEKH